MKTIILKFGGTSVRNELGRTAATNHVKAAMAAGYKVVVVVSAMGRAGEPYATDTLLSLIGGHHACVSSREKDLLISCGEVISSVVFSNTLIESGIRATSFTGGQAGIRTTSEFGNAKIHEMKVARLLDELRQVDVVVVAGFQGVNAHYDVTTIGRGGSDTTAAALGAALGSEYVDIFTDVEGVMTADPRITKLAQLIDVVSYNEISQLAYQGAKVVHPRAVELAREAAVPLRIRSTYSETLGTLITSSARAKKLDVRERLITGIAHLSGISQIKVTPRDDDPFGMQSEVFHAMASAGISVDFINIYPNGLQYTVSRADSERAVEILRARKFEVTCVADCAKISIVGGSISGVPGVTAKIVTPLAARGIQILQSADSYTIIWVLVKEIYLREAVDALHEEFQLYLGGRK